MPKCDFNVATLLNDFDSDYKTHYDKSGKFTIEVKRLRTLGLEVFKTLNNLTHIK